MEQLINDVQNIIKHLKMIRCEECNELSGESFNCQKCDIMLGRCCFHECDHCYNGCCKDHIHQCTCSSGKKCSKHLSNYCVYCTGQEIREYN